MRTASTSTTPKGLGKKQACDNAAFRHVAANIEQYITRENSEALAARTVRAIRAQLSESGARKIAFAWSGGKDSIALGEICRRAGITACVLGMTRLEYPAFLAWVTDNMPDDLTVINTGQDLEWLVRNPHMLFPQTAAIAGKWFSSVQHKAQATYFKQRHLDLILLGRRRADGNYVGTNGANIYAKDGVLRFSPLSDWTHEDILAFNHYNALPIPPIYAWPNGYVVGTGAWAARQYTGSIENGWREVHSIDPSVVEYAATRLPSARAFLDTRR